MIYNDIHSSAFYKGRVISALIVCHSHFPSNSFLLSSFLSICIENSPWYQYFIFTEKNIFVFTHKENIFTSQFSQIYLFPGISLWVSSDKWRPGSRPSVTGPRVETRVDRGVTGDGAGAIGGHGVMMVCCDRPGFNWDVSRINTEITSLALILVMATV